VPGAASQSKVTRDPPWACGNSVRHSTQTATRRHASFARPGFGLQAAARLGTRTVLLLGLLRLLRGGTEQVGLLREGVLRDKLLTLQILNATLHLGDLVSLTSSGTGSEVAGESALVGVCGFLPPVSHMMATMRKARPMRSYDWTFFGRRPWVSALFPESGRVRVGSAGSCSSLSSQPYAAQTPASSADGEVAGVNDLWCDVDPVFELEGDQVGFAVLEFIQSGLFTGGAADVGERFVVIDRGDEERLVRRLRVEWVIELELGRVAGAEAVDLLGGLGLGSMDLIRCLRAQRLQFLLVRLGLPALT